MASQAMAHIFRGSAFRLVEAISVLAMALAAAWIAIASLARATTLKALVAYFREDDASLLVHPGQFRLVPLFGLNFFRVGTTFAAAIGCLGAFLLGGAATSASDPAPGSAVLIILTLGMLVGLAWSVVSWFLSLAAIFVVADGQDTFAAIAAAANLCQTRAGSMFAIGTWFGLAHVAAFVFATSIVAFPLGFAGVLPVGMVLGGVLLVTLLYFAVVDFLHMGRLAAYVAILELPEATVVAPSPPALLPISGAIDRTELILSDVPLAHLAPDS